MEGVPDRGTGEVGAFTFVVSHGWCKISDNGRLKEGQMVDVAVGQLRVEDVELELALVVVVDTDGAVLDDTVPGEVDADAEVDEDDGVLSVELEEDAEELNADVVEGDIVSSLVRNDETDAVEVVEEDGVVSVNPEEVDDELDTGVDEDRGVVLDEDSEDTVTEVELYVAAVDVGLLLQDDTGASDPE